GSSSGSDSRGGSRSRSPDHDRRGRRTAREDSPSRERAPRGRRESDSDDDDLRGDDRREGPGAWRGDARRPEPPQVRGRGGTNGAATRAPRGPREGNENPEALALERATGGEAKAGGKLGGVYIPPYKLAQMMKGVSDRSSEQYQRMSWDALKKSINGFVNKVNVNNLKAIVLELFGENIVRGRALLVRSLMKSQIASPTFTHVYSGLLAVVNTKMPEIGELLLKRVVSQFRRAFKRNDKGMCLTLGRFVAHLVNQQIAHEILVLQTPTDQSVEVACAITTEVGHTLADISPEGMHGVFERLRGVLHEGQIDKRVQYTIEQLFAKRKAKFAEHPGVLPELDLVDSDEQV
ncbi:armadillo-type protein, partial [Pavlovales sp. CCMP2436]